MSPLTTKFDARGWASIPRLLDEGDTARLRDFLIARQHDLLPVFAAWLGERVPDFTTYDTHQRALPSYLARDLPVALRHFLRGEYDLETRLAPLLEDVLASSHTRESIASLVGTDRFYIHWPPMMRFVLPNGPASAVPAHQDWTYNAHLTDFVTIWIPLVDIEDGVGSVVLYEGSHRDGKRGHHKSGAWDFAAIANLTPYRAHRFVARAGDALAFPPTELHASSHHTARKPRYSLDVRVFLEPEHTAKSSFDPRTRSVTRKGSA